MKRLLLITAVLSAFMVTGALPTRINLNQLITGTFASPRVVIALTSGAIGTAQLSGLSLDNSTTPPTLRVLPQINNIIQATTVVQTASAGPYTTPASPCTDLAVFWNGVLQNPGSDYTLASPATSLTWVGTIFPNVGDVIVMKCYP